MKKIQTFLDLSFDRMEPHNLIMRASNNTRPTCGKTRLFYILILIVMFQLAHITSVFAQSSTEQHEARMQLANSMANMTLSIITDQKKKDAAERQEVLQRGFTNVVDIDWIAKFVAGNAWRNASDMERARYTALYRKYLTQVYVATYAESPDRKIRDIKVMGVNDSDVNDSRFITRTQIFLADDKKIKVDYLAEARGQGYKIIDVVIEGVSLLATHRSQFSHIAATQGISGVSAQLEQLVNPAITLSMK